jgi:outer membrane protein assembly factor BamB
VVTWAVSGASAGQPVLGSPDFHPTAERPIGWRGDGTGAWPGAKVVTTWDAKTGENIAWRSPMPAPSFAQPIVVGDKVFTMADPNVLVCVNVHDGRILWQTAIDHTVKMPPKQREEARAARKLIADLRRDYGLWLQKMAAFEKKLKKENVALSSLAVIAKKDATRKKTEDDLFAVLESDDSAIDAPGVDPKIMKEFQTLDRERQEKGFVRSAKYDGIAMKPGRGGKPTPMMKRLVRAWSEFDLYVSDQWGEPWTTETFATPVSDGEAVYAATLNNAVARVNLEGKIEWLVWDHIPERRQDTTWNAGAIGTRFCPSPLLMDNKLIVNHNGELRVYDAKTGKKLWTKYNVYKKTNQFPWRPQPESITPTTTFLPLPDGGRLAVFTDGGGNLYRLEDGMILSKEMAKVIWCSPIFAGDLYCHRSSGPLVKDARGVQRVKALSRDKVEIETLWSVPRGGGGSGARCGTDIFHDGRIILNNKSTDPLTGKFEAIVKPAPEKMDTQNRSSIVAGDHVYCLAWETAWVLGLRDGKLTIVPHAFKDDRVNEDEEWKARYSWTRNMQHSSPCAQANRLFVRSKGYLWCIGDPEQPFPTPKRAPGK